MVRIHASPVGDIPRRISHVAIVKRMLGIWDRAIGQYPCDSVRFVGLPHEPEMPVSPLVYRSQPDPAFVWPPAGHFAPEGHFNGNMSSPVFNDSAASVSTGFPDAVNPPRKLGAAIQAVFDNLRSSHNDLLGVGSVRERCGASHLARFRSLLPIAAGLGLLLAAPAQASLWLAASGAGARADAAQAVAVPVPVEKVADEFARDLSWTIGTHAGDLGLTALAIERCDGRCGEANPIGFNPEARIAMKMAGAAMSGLTLWKLRRAGKSREATVMRWAIVAVNTALMVNNGIHAARKR